MIRIKEAGVLRSSRYPDVVMRCYHCGALLDYVGEHYHKVDSAKTIIVTHLKCLRCPCDVQISYEAMDIEMLSPRSDIDSVDLNESDDNSIED